MSYTAYKFSQHSATDTRDVEYRLLAQVTARLLSLQDKGDNSLHTKRDMIDAVLWNRDIWSALRADLSSDGNQLPMQLRGSLVSIAIWVEKESLQLLDGKGDLNAVIEINRNIMAGLKPHRDESDDQPMAPAEPAAYTNGESFIAAV